MLLCRNNRERKLDVVRLIKPYHGHIDSVATDSDTDSDGADNVDADADDTANEEPSELMTASQSADEQSLASAGKH